jgi:hypothetical protein
MKDAFCAYDEARKRRKDSTTTRVIQNVTEENKFYKTKSR